MAVRSPLMSAQEFRDFHQALKALEGELVLDWDEVDLFANATLSALPVRVPHLREVDVSSQVEGEDPLTQLFGVFSATGIADVAEVHVSCGFQERNSPKQTRAYYDRFWIIHHEQRTWFGYSSNGSRVMNEAEYAQSFVGELIEVAALPLRLEPRLTGGYDLQHLEPDRELRIATRSVFGPTGFCCEVNDPCEAMFRRLRESLEHFASQRYNYAWTVLADGRRQTEANAAYQQLLSCDFPAEEYRVGFTADVKGITDLELTRQSFGVGEAELWEYRPPGGKSIGFEVQLTPDGYRVDAHTRRKRDVEVVERLFERVAPRSGSPTEMEPTNVRPRAQPGPFTARTVDWKLVTTLAAEGRLAETIGSDAVDDILLGDPPWPSGSHIHWVVVSDIYEALRNRLDERRRGPIDAVMSQLISTKAQFPWDVEEEVDPNSAASFISPETSERFLERFAAVDYEALDAAYDAWSAALTQRDKEKFSIWDEEESVVYPSQDYFTGYIRQWQDLLRYAHERQLGVWLAIS